MKLNEIVELDQKFGLRPGDTFRDVLKCRPLLSAKLKKFCLDNTVKSEDYKALLATTVGLNSLTGKYSTAEISGNIITNDIPAAVLRVSYVENLGLALTPEYSLNCIVKLKLNGAYNLIDLRNNGEFDGVILSISVLSNLVSYSNNSIHSASSQSGLLKLHNVNYDFSKMEEHDKDKITPGVSGWVIFS